MHTLSTQRRRLHIMVLLNISAPCHAFTVSKTRRQRVSFLSHRWVVGPEWVHCNKTHAKDRPHHDQSRREMDPTYFSKYSFKQRSIKKNNKKFLIGLCTFTLYRHRVTGYYINQTARILATSATAPACGSAAVVTVSE